MSRVRATGVRVAAVVLACGLGLAGCGGDPGVTGTRRALERSGYRHVVVAVRTGGGIDVVKVDGVAPAGAGAEQAAEVVWRTLPVRFDQLVVAVVPAMLAYRSDDLVARFGPRDPTLDRGRARDTPASNSRRELLGVLALGALLAGAGLAAGTALVRRGLRLGRERQDQAEGPISGLGAGSPTADTSGSGDDADAIPS